MPTAMKTAAVETTAMETPDMETPAVETAETGMRKAAVEAAVPTSASPAPTASPPPAAAPPTANGDPDRPTPIRVSIIIGRISVIRVVVRVIRIGITGIRGRIVLCGGRPRRRSKRKGGRREDGPSKDGSSQPALPGGNGHRCLQLPGPITPADNVLYGYDIPSNNNAETTQKPSLGARHCDAGRCEPQWRHLWRMAALADGSRWRQSGGAARPRSLRNRGSRRHGVSRTSLCRGRSQLLRRAGED